MTEFPLITRIHPSDATYPPLLKEIPNPPSPLYLLGAVPSPSDVTIAVVGTRKATREGMLFAKQIGSELSKAGAVVVSGLALGIDGAAHEGVISVHGRTVAVLASGLDLIYPRTHENLAREILDNKGAIVSEYKKGAPALPHQFLERNRIVSGLSVATVVIEAPIHSGALVTAKFALEQGRELFVFPGPVNHPNYKGSHVLLRNGARLVTSAAEILEDLENTIANYQMTLPLSEKKNPLSEVKDEAGLLIVNALKNSSEPLSVDNLAENTKLELHIVNQRLTFLTLQGIIEEKNGRFRLKQ
ncbi:MAG: DNA-processing protein DprA [Minisyncoccia bacterium]|jgi:DNA processing protein